MKKIIKSKLGFRELSFKLFVIIVISILQIALLDNLIYASDLNINLDEEVNLDEGDILTEDQAREMMNKNNINMGDFTSDTGEKINLKKVVIKKHTDQTYYIVGHDDNNNWHGFHIDTSSSTRNQGEALGSQTIDVIPVNVKKRLQDTERDNDPAAGLGNQFSSFFGNSNSSNTEDSPALKNARKTHERSEKLIEAIKKIRPTGAPTDAPTNSPTSSPTNSPTDLPTNSPTDSPTNSPTDSPTNSPTDSPTSSPTYTPAETSWWDLFFNKDKTKSSDKSSTEMLDKAKTKSSDKLSTSRRKEDQRSIFMAEKERQGEEKIE